MAYRNKTYVCFDGDQDMHYYRLMCAWKNNQGMSFKFHNAHELNAARDSSNEESIKRQLRERLVNSKNFIALIGEKTRHLYKFVKWEIEQAIDLDLPIIAVNLNKERKVDSNLAPPILRDNLSLHVSFNCSIIEYALNEWTDVYYDYKREGKNQAYCYDDDIYQKLGL